MGAPSLTVPCPPGDYEVSIKFNEEHIPDSPFIVPVASHSDDARRLTVTSLQVLGTPPGIPWDTPGFTDAPWVPRSLLGHSEPLLRSWDTHCVPPLGLLWHPWTLWDHLSLPHVTPRPPLCPSVPALGPSLVPALRPPCHTAPLCHLWDLCVTPLSPLGSTGATALSHMSPLAPSLVPPLSLLC